MPSIEQLIERVQKTQHGFTDIRKAADEIVRDQSPKECAAIAKTLFTSEIPQARMLATFIWGHLAAESEEAFRHMREVVSRDPDWRVQEILAQAFDLYCSTRGYEQSVAIIQEWLVDENPNVRRAVTEGLRIWTSRPYFRDHPETAIQFLSRLKNDPSEYVRKSVGNALRDISRKYPDLIKAETEQWDRSQKGIAQVYKLASKFLK